MIPRILLKRINEQLIKAPRAVLLIGPRQTGKTTLLREFLQSYGDYLFLDGDDPIVREELGNANVEKLRRIIGKHKTLFIDEAQRIPEIGITLKLLTDQFSQVQLFVSGSSALELSSTINEPLTGRKWEYQLFPISWQELEDHIGYLSAKQQLPQRLIYGMYPEVINSPGDERAVLLELATSYLYKDVLSLSGIRRPEVVEKLLKALALQVGNEVSYNELAQTVQADKNTVSNYLDILEKMFVIFRLQPLSRNLRNEISTSRKIYFYDNGILNTLISNFNPLELRRDKGALWENFLMSERAKYLHYNGSWVNRFFWRTTAQQEIDYIEEENGGIKAYEFKFGSKKHKVPLTFRKAYPETSFEIVSPDNMSDFLCV